MEYILEAFESAVDSLLSADPRNSSKGRKIKEWAKTNFNLDCSVSHVTDPRAIGNRVSEQMRYNSPLVFFVCDKSVNIDTLKGYVDSNTYSNLSDVLIIGDVRPYDYIVLLHYKDNPFYAWIKTAKNISIERKNIEGDTQSDESDTNVVVNELSGRTAYTSIIPKPQTTKQQPNQQIFYGAPGTGKSHKIKEETEGKSVIRTTFHPDSDYSTFVGCYKPGMKSSDRIYSAEELAVKLKEIKNSGVTYPCHKFAAQYWRSLKDISADTIKQILIACGFTESMNVEISKGVAIGQEYLNKDEDGKIVYTFTPQAFTNAYVKAWNTTEDVYLIIEEINRGNCAQIFGDLFQLLDRGSDGRSEYPVDADGDLADYLQKALSDSTRTDFPDGVKEGKKLVLPKNLYIWATMNTSDQSLFPIDSAFKRRWDWKYIPVEDAGKNWKIMVNNNEYDWYQFLEDINKEVFDLTHSEDKQLGYFFAKAKDNVIDAETLVNKVYFYLWTDVFKDYEYESLKAFRKADGKGAISFKDFFANGKVNEDMAEQVILNLKNKKPVENAE